MEPICVGGTAELPPGRMAEVNVDGRLYLICNVDGAFFGLDGACPHRGAPLAAGALHGHTVVCPWHAWEFDCRTGVGDCGDVATAAVTIEGDRIYLHARAT
jgi:nitrite reductase/ring-hydroxylating ferredoxin subunit